MPYREHPSFESPTEDTKIWRYMSFTKFVAILHSTSLYFTRADKMAEMDPYEGAATYLDEYLSATSYDDLLPEWQAQFQSQEDYRRFQEDERFDKGAIGRVKRQITFINCWYMGEDDSDAMWKIYAGAQEGVCVQSTFKKLVTSLNETTDHIHIGKIKYKNYSNERIVSNNGFDSFLWKRLSFRHEQELRAVFVRMDDLGNAECIMKDGHTYQVAKTRFPNKCGENIPVKLQELVDNVYIAPTSPQWFCELVESVITKMGFSFAIRYSDLAKSPLPYL